jgi:hypothetical protein
MTVQLTPHGQQLLEAALARGVGCSPEEVVERALEVATSAAATLSEEEVERRRQAVASMLAFHGDYHLTLGPGERIQDLIHEGHKYRPDHLSSTLR